MAAEKLTKQRLVQISVMMLLLVCAFSWRTFEHFQQQTDCLSGKNCIIDTDKGIIELTWISDDKSYNIAINKAVLFTIESLNDSAYVNKTVDLYNILPSHDHIELLITFQTDQSTHLIRIKK